jgi:hypothetical protein
MRAAEADKTCPRAMPPLIALLLVGLITQPSGELTASLVREPVPHGLICQARQGGPCKGQFLPKDLSDLRQVRLAVLLIRWC